MLHLLLQTTQPVLSTWTPDAVIRVLGEILAVALAIFGAYKGLKADTKSTANASRVEAVEARTDNHDNQLTNLALNMPAPTPPKGPTP